MISIVSVSAITGSIGNAKMILSKTLYPELGTLDGKKTVTIEKSILVKNVNDVPVNVTLEADADGEKFIDIIDESFILESSNNGIPAEKKAVFQIRIKDKGYYEGKINVFFKPLEKNQPGIVLTSTVIVNAGEGDEIDNSDDGDDGDNNDNRDDSNLIKNVLNNAKISKEAVFLGATTLLLIVLLIGLVYIMKKKSQHHILNKEVKLNEGKKGKDKN